MVKFAMMPVMFMVPLVALSASAEAVSLTSYFQMEEGSGNSTSDSVSGNDSGTLTSGVSWSAADDSAPVSGNSCSLNFPGESGGIGQLVSVSGSNPGQYVNTNSAFSVSVWVKPDYIGGATISYFPMIVTLPSNSGSWQISLAGRTDYNGIGIGSASSWARLRCANSFHAVDELVDGDWHNIVATYNGSGAATAANFAVYFDGSLISMVKANAFAAVSGGVQIGAEATRSECNFNGLIDELAVFDGVLSTDQISALASGADAYSALGVPEPSSLLMLVLGGLGLTATARRRKRLR